MVSFASIKQSISNINYGWNLPSLMVFVPGLSLLVQKIKTADITARIVSNLPDPANCDEVDDPDNQSIANYSQYLANFSSSLQAAKGTVKSDPDLIKMYKWHAIGGVVQLVALFVLLSIDGKHLSNMPLIDKSLILAVYILTINQCQAIANYLSPLAAVKWSNQQYSINLQNRSLLGLFVPTLLHNCVFNWRLVIPGRAFSTEGEANRFQRSLMDV